MPLRLKVALIAAELLLQLAPFLELMGRGQWEQAQFAIDALAAKNPQSRRYQALACGYRTI